MFPDVEEIWVSCDETRGAPLDSSGEVLVVIRVVAYTAQHVVACDEIGQQPIGSISVDDRHVELAEPRRIADDLDLGDLAVRDREAERSHQSSLRRHHDADGPIHERGPREPRHVPVGDRPLRPDRRAADLGRRAGGRHVRANHEIRIEDGEQAFEVAAA